MSYYKKKKVGGIVTGIVVSALLLGGVGALGYLSKGFKDWNVNNWFAKTEEETEDPSENGGVDVQEQSNMRVRKTSEGTNEDGHPYVTLQYFIVPSNATDVHFNLSMEWASPSEASISDYFTYSIDEESKTITITNLQAFSVVANLRMQSTSNEDIYIVLGVHCAKKFLGWSSSTSKTYYLDFTADINPASIGQTTHYSNLKNYLASQLLADLSNGFSSVFTDDNIDETNAFTSFTKQSSWSVYGNSLSSSLHNDELNISQGIYPTGDTNFLSEFDTYISGEKPSDILFYPEYFALKGAIQDDIDTWSNEKKTAVSSYAYYGIRFESKITMKCCDKQKTITNIVYAMFHTSEFQFNIPLESVSLEDVGGYIMF